jgi:hypothetical protein
MTLTDARDVAIIVLCVESLIIGSLLIVLVLQLRGLIRLLEQELRPILASLQDTAGTVRGTATIVSDYVVSPVARLASIWEGVREGAEVLTRRSPRGRSS